VIKSIAVQAVSSRILHRQGPPPGPASCAGAPPTGAPQTDCAGQAPGAGTQHHAGPSGEQSSGVMSILLSHAMSILGSGLYTYDASRLGLSHILHCLHVGIVHSQVPPPEAGVVMILLRVFQPGPQYVELCGSIAVLHVHGPMSPNTQSTFTGACAPQSANAGTPTGSRPQSTAP